MRHLNVFRVMGGVLALAATLLTTPAFGQIQTVIQRDDDPGSGSLFRKFRAPYLSDAPGERVTFRATSKATGSSSIKGIYRLDSSGSGPVIVQRNQFFLSQRFRNFKRPSINLSGDLAWFAFLSDGNRGIFRTVGVNSPIPITLTLQSTPVGGVFTDLGPPELTAAGAVIFWGETSAVGIDEGIFRCQGGDGDCFSGSSTGVMDVLVSTGQPIPDQPGRFLCTFQQGLHQSTYGISFRADTKTNCLSSGEAALPGVFRLDFAGTVGVETVALKDDATPLISGQTAVYDRFRDRPSIRDNGVVVFRANTGGNFKTEVIFRCDPAACPAAPAELLIVKGDLDADMNELRRFSRPQIADNGDVAFQAKPKGTTASGPTIYLRRASGTLDRVVTKGDTAPGSNPEIKFRRPGMHSLSPAGSLAFRATTSKTVAVPSNTGIYLLP